MLLHNNTKRPEIILAGCSAGALAAIANTWKVEKLSTQILGQKPIFATISYSGIFPPHDNMFGTPLYHDFMRAGFELAQPRFTFDPESDEVNPCYLQYENHNDRYKSLFSTANIATITTPIFLVNSVLDSYGTQCIYSTTQIADQGCALSQEWKHCFWSKLSKCTKEQNQKLQNDWVAGFLNFVGSSQIISSQLKLQLQQSPDRKSPSSSLFSEPTSTRKSMTSHLDFNTQRTHIRTIPQLPKRHPLGVLSQSIIAFVNRCWGEV